MHPSLHDLTTEARVASSPAMVRGILAEAQELLRNALDHGEPATDLAAWYSRTLRECAASPAVEELLPGSRLLFTGAVARDDALPTDPVSWLILGETDGANAAVGALFHGADLPVGELPDPAPQEEWDARAARAASEGDAEGIAGFIDADLLSDPALADHLIVASLAHRPPKLRLAEGLPDYDTPVDVRGTLLSPAVAVARWAGLLAEAPRGDVPMRLAAALDRGVLTRDEAEALAQAWDTGLSMELRAWRHGTWGQEETMRSLPSLDRSAYGAAARLVSVALHSIAGRHGLSVD